MAVVFPNQGEQLALDAVTGKTAATALTLRLYANDYVPVAGTTEANVTEAAGGGYAAIPLTAGNWTTTLGSPTASVQPAQTYTFTGALTANPSIYGYYITNAAGQLVSIERLAAAFTPVANGDNLVVTPRITLGSVTSD